MGKFLNGLFIGFSVGLFIAPQAGEETRRMIMERVVALRKRVLSEDEPHFSIDTHPPQVPPFLAQPAQPATEFFGEPELQDTASEPLAQPATAFFSEPQVQGITSESPTQPIETLSSEPEEQGITSIPSTYTMPTLSNQNSDMTGNTSSSSDTAQTLGSTTNPGFVPDANPDQPTPSETSRPDTAITEKLPPLSSSSNTPGRTARKKASARTPNTGKSRGHSRS